MRFSIMVVMTLVFLTTSACCLSRKDDFGSFSGPIVTEWIDDGRTMMVINTVTYQDPYEKIWEAPQGWVVNGSSIPRVFWTIIGSPYVGKHRNASVFHDVACDRKNDPWEAVHIMYYNACRLGGVSEEKAKLMFAAVWMGGPRWEPPNLTMSGSSRVTAGKYSLIMVEAHKEDVEVSQKARLVAVEQAIKANKSITLEEIIRLVE
jgi:hypothetical protein